MPTPISSFEIVESIRFFASLVGTEGLSQSNNQVANEYISDLLRSLEPSVRETTAKAAGLLTLS